MKNLPPPLILRAKMIFTQLNVPIFAANPTPLISPIHPSFPINKVLLSYFHDGSVKDLSNESAYQIFQAILSNYPNFTEIYTDGSRVTEPEISCGASVIVKMSHTTEMLNFRLPVEFSITSCELYAISQALKYITLSASQQRNYIILTVQELSRLLGLDFHLWQDLASVGRSIDLL